MSVKGSSASRRWRARRWAASSFAVGSVRQRSAPESMRAARSVAVVLAEVIATMAAVVARRHVRTVVVSSVVSTITSACSCRPAWARVIGPSSLTPYGAMNAVGGGTLTGAGAAVVAGKGARVVSSLLRRGKRIRFKASVTAPVRRANGARSSQRDVAGRDQGTTVVDVWA